LFHSDFFFFFFFFFSCCLPPPVVISRSGPKASVHLTPNASCASSTRCALSRQGFQPESPLIGVPFFPMLLPTLSWRILGLAFLPRSFFCARCFPIFAWTDRPALPTSQLPSSRQVFSTFSSVLLAFSFSETRGKIVAFSPDRTMLPPS